MNKKSFSYFDDSRITYLTLEQILIVHEYQLSTYGGLDGILNLNLLESAIFRPQTAFGGKEKYVSAFDKCASLMHSLIKNHPFVDGNKRTALVSGLLFLQLNGYCINYNQSKLVDFIIQIESNKMDLFGIAQFLENGATLEISNNRYASILRDTKGAWKKV